MIRIQNLRPMAKGERDLDNVVLSLRLRGAEAARFWRVMDEAKSRNAYIDRSDVLKELLRLAPLHVLTEADVQFFRTGEKEVMTTVKSDGKIRGNAEPKRIRKAK